MIPFLLNDVRQMVFEFCHNSKDTFFAWRLVNRDWNLATHLLLLAWVGGIYLEDNGFAHLVGKFSRNIMSLDMSRCDLITSHCWPHLEKLFQLRSFTPPRTVDNGDLAFISHFLATRLKELKIVNNTILSSRCLQTVCRLSQLESLELSGVDDMFISEYNDDDVLLLSALDLSTFTRLRNLTLRPLHRFDDIPSMLSNRDLIISLSLSLEELNLSGVDFSLYSIDTCMQYFSCLTRLHKLGFHAALGETLNVSQVVERLTMLTSLQSLDLQSASEETYVDEEGQAILLCGQHLPRLRYLNVLSQYSCADSLRALSRRAASLTSLRSLNLTLTGGAVLEPFFLQLPLFLETLVLTETKLHAGIFAAIGSLSCLHSLSLMYCTSRVESVPPDGDKTYIGSVFSRAVTGLRRLELTQCDLPYLTDAMFTKFLASQIQLEWLSVLCDELPLHIVCLPVLPQLITLAISVDILAELDLSGNSRLCSLSVGSRQNVSINGLETIKQLQEMYLRTGRPVNVPMFSFPSTVRVLHLHASFATKQLDLQSIMHATNLHSLAVSSGRFEDAVWRQIAQCLGHLRTLMLPVTSRNSEHAVLALTTLTRLRKLELVQAADLHLVHRNTIDKLKRLLPNCKISQQNDNSNDNNE